MRLRDIEVRFVAVIVPETVSLLSSKQEHLLFHIRKTGIVGLGRVREREERQEEQVNGTRGGQVGLERSLERAEDKGKCPDIQKKS